MVDRAPIGRLRLLREDDLAMVLAWRNHDCVRLRMFNRQPISADEHKAWFERASQATDHCLFLFELSGVPSGFVNLQPVASGGITEWGFYRAPDAPAGSGQLLGRVTLDHAFAELGMHKICGKVLAENTASIRFHQRLGFCLEGTLREQHRDDEGYHNVLVFGLLANEWHQHVRERSDA